MIVDMLDNLSDVASSCGVGVEMLEEPNASSPPRKRARAEEEEEQLAEFDSPAVKGSGFGKRGKYQSNIGIGALGIPLTEFMSNTAKMKKCTFCKNMMALADPIFPDRTRSWFKPNFGGNICAYCGFTKVKLWPGKAASAVLTIISTQQDQNRRFFDFSDVMIEEYKAGNKQAKDIGKKAKERVESVNDVNIQLSVEGTIKLLSSYVPKLGDPHTNGLGHTVKLKQLWKDGTYQDVVLIPNTASDEMKCTWNNIQGVRHQKAVHDGELTESPNQLKELLQLACEPVVELHDRHNVRHPGEDVADGCFSGQCCIWGPGRNCCGGGG